MSGGSSKSSSKSRSSSRSQSFSMGGSNSSTGVWDDQAGYLNELYAGASADLANPRGYGDDRYAGVADQTQQAIDRSYGTYDRQERNLDAASADYQDTMAGKYLDSNPHLDAAFEQGARGIRREYMGAVQGLGSRMEGAGRSGSGASQYRESLNQEALATGLGDYATNVYGGNYARERAIMASAGDRVGAMGAAGWDNSRGLSQAGDRDQMNRQGVLDDQNQRFQFAQNIRGDQLAQFRDLIGGPTMTSEASSSEASSSLSRSKSRSKSRGKSAQGGL